MVPISIVVRVMALMGWDLALAQYFEPLMNLVGLPGLTALVWVSAIVANLYAGMLVFASLWYEGWLTTLQISQLCLMMLLCHNIFVESMVCHKIGLHFVRVSIFRFVSAILAGYICQFFFWLDKPPQGELLLKADQLASQMSWLEWSISEFKNYLLIFAIIVVLIFVLEVFKKIGVEKLIAKALTPFFKLMGLSSQVISMVLIGISMGLAYGGGLMMKEVKEKRFKKADIVFALLLMGNLHAIFEDTLLMLVLQADWVVVLVFRTVFTLMVVWILFKLIKILPSWLNRFIFGCDNDELFATLPTNPADSNPDKPTKQQP